MLTLEPATAWGLHDRGLLREGLAADLIVFDPDRVAPAMPEVVNDLPAGARRLRQKATGLPRVRSSTARWCSATASTPARSRARAARPAGTALRTRARIRSRIGRRPGAEGPRGEASLSKRGGAPPAGAARRRRGRRSQARGAVARAVRPFEVSAAL